MEAQHVERLPVMDEADRLLGIVSRGDLLRILLRRDDAIRDEITEDVLWRTMGLGPPEVTVEVRDGRVDLGGSVEFRSLVPVIERLCRTGGRENPGPWSRESRRRSQPAFTDESAPASEPPVRLLVACPVLTSAGDLDALRLPARLCRRTPRSQITDHRLNAAGQFGAIGGPGAEIRAPVRHPA